MHVPALASAWLQVLAEDGGLPDISATTITHKGRPLNRPVLEDPANTPSDPDTYPARLEGGQVVWVKLDGQKTGNQSVVVVEKPTKDKAILAALTLMEGRPVDTKELKEFLPLVNISHPDGMWKSVDEVSSSLLVSEPDFKRFLNFDMCLRSSAVRYALALLRYYRPDFDALPEVEKRGLLIGCCERINMTIDTTRQLTEFLEYGVPNRDRRRTVENPSRDVKVAVMRDVSEASYREIAKWLAIDISEKARHVGDFSTVAKMVSRGRDILERAFGKDGWRRKREEMRAEFVRRSALSFTEEYVEDMAGFWDISPQDARRILADEGNVPPEVERKSGSRLQSMRDYYITRVAPYPDNRISS
jgi:hypothetical protein